ncbi:MAG TPA: acyl-CoA dehydrogenase family protein [Solirubrobacteraceae bacterium]|jgi:alkylation response protein AidB-like acyl-CoA dehydrogenase|nr:acyl-CoA dehydrogenase family protein [Solirubrobacteraceae bacterium]
MRRTLFEDEHQAFRESFRRFLTAEIAPRHEAWEKAGIVDKNAFRKAGNYGFLSMAVPESYGGAGVSDFRFNTVIGEEVQRLGLAGFGTGVTLHNDVCTPYFLAYATDEQRRRWLPGIASGELITAIAMTEPGTGSDLAALSTGARVVGDNFVVNGSKTFITNGINADLVIVAVRTDSSQTHRGISLLVVERGTEGFERGRNLEKLGQHSQDTAELFFNDATVPPENLLGELNHGFEYLLANLAQERLSIAVSAVGAADAALQWTRDYTRERRAFGKAIRSFQNTQFLLAELTTEVLVARAYVDQCIEALVADDLTAVDAAMAKLWATEMQGRVLDRCLQMFGGYGYMMEYPIARAWADARATRIYGGTNEVMKEVIQRSLE